MKKLISVFSAVVILAITVCMITVSVSADIFASSGECGDHLYWEFDVNSSTMTISGTGPMWDYEHTGYLTTAPWKEFEKKLCCVVIENGVESVGKYAFSDCSALRSVSIADSVTAIGEGAFQYCYDLETVKLPGRLTSIPTLTFSCCVALTDVKIPEGVTEIGDSAFLACEKLSEITIPESVTVIDEWAFDYCLNLSAVTIGGSVERIGLCAFNRCRNLSVVKCTGTYEMWRNADINKGNDALIGAARAYVACTENGHTVTANDGAAATCTSAGYTGETYCAVCGLYFDRSNLIEPLGHEYDGDDVCTRCGKTKAELTHGDINGDGKVNAMDVNLLKRVIVGK